MPLTADEAADIAQRHGLGLTDAAGLFGLADSAEDAERIAARFAKLGDTGRPSLEDAVAVSMQDQAKGRQERNAAALGGDEA